MLRNVWKLPVEKNLISCLHLLCLVSDYYNFVMGVSHCYAYAEGFFIFCFKKGRLHPSHFFRCIFFFFFYVLPLLLREMQMML